MATYKVAQDVEADDKLIGPFSFRQFVYLIIVAIALALAWGLGRVFIGLAIIPAPIILFFGALALPLKKDQPMEVYLAAVMSYYLKPRKRLWEPDGIDSLVEVTAPRVIESHRAKNLSSSEAERRLSYLADIADTEGWAVRHAAKPFINNSVMIDDAYNEAQQTPDVLDDSGTVAQAFDSRITQADTQRRQAAMARMQQAAQQQTASQYQPTPQPVAIQQQVAPQYSDPYQGFITSMQQPTPDQTVQPAPVQYNPYPDSIRQSVIQPLRETAPAPTPTPQPVPIQSRPPISAKSTSETPVSPDIISLANNSDLSIETIQHEANRIHKKAKADDGEVFISLH